MCKRWNFVLQIIWIEYKYFNYFLEDSLEILRNNERYNEKLNEKQIIIYLDNAAYYRSK